MTFRIDRLRPGRVARAGSYGASDTQIFERAAAGGNVVVTADSDFPMLLASRRSLGPSVILPRQVAEQTWTGHLALVTGNLPAVRADHEAGAVVSLSPTRLAVRRLPID